MIIHAQFRLDLCWCCGHVVLVLRSSCCTAFGVPETRLLASSLLSRIGGRLALRLEPVFACIIAGQKSGPRYKLQSWKVGSPSALIFPVCVLVGGLIISAALISEQFLMPPVVN